MEKKSSATGNILRRLLVSFILLVIPAILLITSLETIKARDKAWYGGGYDPEYAYLFNSLNTARFRLPGHIDHPGTTVQVTGGLVLLGNRAFDQSDKSLKTAVLSDPEHYIRILNVATAVIGSLALFILALFLAGTTGNVWFALLLQLTPFISGFVLFNGFTRITQELMLMVAAFSLAAVSIVWYLDNKQAQTRNYILLFGIISGFGMASKLLFAPLMLIPMVLFYPLKEKFRYLITTGISFVVFTLPVIRLYPNMIYWVYRLFFHTGQYGTGSKGIIDTSVYFEELIDLFFVSPVLAMIFGISILVLILLVFLRIRNGYQTGKRASRMLLAITLAQAAGYLLVAKQPKEAYLLPYESIAAVNVIILLHLAVSLIPAKMAKNVFTGFITICCILLIVPYGLSRKKTIYSAERNPVWESDWQAATCEAGKNAVIFANPGSSPVTGLYFGNAYSLRRYVPELKEIYPDYYSMDLSTGTINHWSLQPVSLDSLFKAYKGRLSFIGPSALSERLQNLLGNKTSGWRFEPVYFNEYQVIMKPVELDARGSTVERRLVFSAAEAEPQHHESVLRSEGIELPGLLSFERKYSGESSILTNPQSPYAFSVLPDLLQPGDKLEVSVFYSGNYNDVRLVLSGDDASKFYNTASPDSAGVMEAWYRVTMSAVIPETMKGKRVKLYAWNKGIGNVYFDNFRVEIYRPLKKEEY